MQRRNGGEPIRTAMAGAGLKIDDLVAATKAADPEGKGVGRASIGFLISTGKSARDRIGDRAARLIATALNDSVDALFAPDDIAMPAGYASTTRMSSAAAVDIKPAPRARHRRSSAEPLLTLQEESDLICRGRTWFYEMRRQFPAGHATPFPIHYAGKSPRFIHTEVLAWMDLAFPMGLAAA